MQQVLFWIPLSSLAAWLPDLPIYGYGTMLFLAFVLCTWLASRLGEREGFPRERIQDMAIWIFITGIIGARVTFMIQEWDSYQQPLRQFFAIWDGGLVFYGSFFGGIVGFFLAYFLFLRKAGISPWKMMDVIAPCLALGLCLGRLGCLLNGCCYGNVACSDCVGLQFPFSSPPRYALVERGLQTPAGFTMASRQHVGVVAPGSPAAEAGLQQGDQILRIEGRDVETPDDINRYLVRDWKRGKNDVQLSVKHANGQDEDLAPFAPHTLALHPTQIYESISMALLVFVLLAYYPLRRHEGSVFVLFMVAYGVHRFLNEILRTDNKPVAFDMTLSQNVSVLLLVAAAILAVVVWRRPALPAPTTA